MVDDRPDPKPASPGELLVRLRWPLAVLGLGLIAWLAWERTRGALEQAPRATAEALGAIAERFSTGRITTTFTASLPRLQPGGNLLELASYEATETFRRTDERAVFFDLVPLGTTVSEIRVPVTYRYHLRLDDPWQLETRGAVCAVRAPRIRPSLPPALHSDRMEKRSEAGWFRFDALQQMETLERSLTPTLSARAGSVENLAFVRETGRRRVAEFVRDWLLREDHWRADRFRAITVVFEDEPLEGASVRPPTLIRSQD